MSKNLDLTTSIIIIYSSSSLTSVFSILLSLLPLSCMVAPIRELGNIILSTAITCSTTNNMALIQDIDIVVDLLDNLFDIDNNFDEIRDYSLALNAHKPRSPLISLSDCNEECYV